MGLVRLRRPMVSDGAAAGPPAPDAGFVYPGSTGESWTSDEDQATIIGIGTPISGHAVPAMSEGMMAIWRCIPSEDQDAYWSGFFHSAFRRAWNTGAGPDVADTGDASYRRYIGCHPYVNGLWSMSINGADETTNDQGNAVEVDWGREHLNVLFARPNTETGRITYRFYYDYEANPARYIERTESTDKLDPVSAEIVIHGGDARWNMGNERWRGVLGLWDLYFGNLNFTLTDLAAAIANPLDSSLAANRFYTKRNPTSVTDLEDNGGSSVSAAFIIGSEVSMPTLQEFG